MAIDWDDIEIIAEDENIIRLTDWNDIEIISEEEELIKTSDSDIINFEASDRMIIFGGERGEKGDRGEQGRAGEVRVGNVTTLPAGSRATVVNRGTSQSAILDFGIPKGEDGEGVASWGHISGNLVDQTDLANALSDKVDTSDLGALAVKDTADYATDVTNKPTLGTMASQNDAPSDGKEYNRKNGTWSEAQHGISSVAWGDIEGTLSDQTDLQDALDAKADTADLGDLATKDMVDWNADISNIPSVFPPSTHTHDDRYYTESEVDAYITAVNNRIDALNDFSIHICTSAEYDSTTYVPTVQNPATNVFYLVPSGTAPDIFTEWIYVNGWEKFGSTRVDLSDYVTTSQLNTALASKQNTLTFDNAPTENSANPVKSGGVYSALSGKADTADLGDLAEKDSVDWDTDIDNIPETFPPSAHTHDDRYYTESETDTLLSAKTNSADLGDLATQDTVDYVTEVTNKPTLGDLADHDTVDYSTEVTNKPTLGDLSALDSIDYTSNKLTNKPTLGTLASKNAVDYSTSEVTNKPTLGTMSSINDVSSSNNKYYGRRNASWVDLDDRYFKNSGGTVDGSVYVRTEGLVRGSSTSKYSNAFVQRDENNKTIMVLQTNNTTAGTITTSLYSSNTDPDDNTKDIHNTLSLSVAANGTKSVSLDKVSWRKALYGDQNMSSAGDYLIAISSGYTTGGYLAKGSALSWMGGAPLASPTFTGTPKAPTASSSTNDTQIATTAFVHSVPKIYYGSGTISAGATSKTFSNSKITTTMRLINFSLGTPRNVPKAITCTIAAGKITFSGTFLGATTIDFLLAECETLTLT